MVAILLLNVMDGFSVDGGALLDRPCMVFQRIACCACDPSVHLIVGVVAILLFNGMDGFSVDGGALLNRPCMVFQRMCVLCM